MATVFRAGPKSAKIVASSWRFTCRNLIRSNLSRNWWSILASGKVRLLGSLAKSRHRRFSANNLMSKLPEWAGVSSCKSWTRSNCAGLKLACRPCRRRLGKKIVDKPIVQMWGKHLEQCSRTCLWQLFHATKATQKKPTGSVASGNTFFQTELSYRQMFATISETPSERTQRLRNNNQTLRVWLNSVAPSGLRKGCRYVPDASLLNWRLRFARRRMLSCTQRQRQSRPLHDGLRKCCRWGIMRG